MPCPALSLRHSYGSSDLGSVKGVQAVRLRQGTPCGRALQRALSETEKARPKGIRESHAGSAMNLSKTKKKLRKEAKRLFKLSNAFGHRDAGYKSLVLQATCLQNAANHIDDAVEAGYQTTARAIEAARRGDTVERRSPAEMLAELNRDD